MPIPDMHPERSDDEFRTWRRHNRTEIRSFGHNEKADEMADQDELDELISERSEANPGFSEMVERALQEREGTGTYV
jgi:hypothetical protein